MAFHDVVLGVDVSALRSTPTWPVDIIKLGGGGEQRILLQGDSRREYEATHSVLTWTQARDIVKFFNARRAQLFSFKVKDQSLFTVTAEPLGTGGGIGSTNQLTLNEGDVTNAYNREIYLPKSGTVQIRANGNLKTEGVDYTLAYTGATGGLVTWLVSVSGQTLTWTGEFYIPVRFDVSSLPDIELIVQMSENVGLAQGPAVAMREVDFLGEFV